MEQVRENCLKALKERLIERANIIQARHDEETAALAKRQANFQRDRDNLGRAEEEEYEQVSGANGLTHGRRKRPCLQNSPHDHMILRVDLVGSHGRWKRPCLQTAHMTI